MSKVVHLSDEAHNKAKAYCKRFGLKMSDWVAVLIERAMNDAGTLHAVTDASEASTARESVHSLHRASGVVVAVPGQPTTVETAAPSAEVHTLQSKKKKLERMDVEPQRTEDGLPPYAAPPFWSKASS